MGFATRLVKVGLAVIATACVITIINFMLWIMLCLNEEP
jgi:hypothetical protein